MKNAKYYSYLSLGMVVIIIAIASVSLYRLHHQTQNATQQTSSGLSAGESGLTPSTSQAPVANIPPRVNLTYAAAVTDNPYRIQFSQCLAVVNLPGIGTLSLRAGDKFMLDNRDPVAHTFKVMGRTIIIQGDSFSVLTANKIGSYPIACDGANRVLLQVEP